MSFHEVLPLFQDDTKLVLKERGSVRGSSDLERNQIEEKGGEVNQSRLIYALVPIRDQGS